MRIRVARGAKILAVWCALAACCGGALRAQDEGDLSAKRKILGSVGPGLRAMRETADGKLYVLASSAGGLAAYDANENRVLYIAEDGATGAAGKAAIVFGDDFDVDATGKIYVADQGGRGIKIFSADGALIRSIGTTGPMSIAVLPEGEVAVTATRDEHQVVVYDKTGRDVREFGTAEQLAERADLNRYLNLGRLFSDAQGHLYYAFLYFPEPTVRVYDRFGFGATDVQYTAVDAMPAAQAARKEILRQDKRNGEPSLKRTLTAAAVDSSSGEVWIAAYNTLLHFDKEGNRRSTYKLYTMDGTRLEATVLVVDKDRILVGNERLGIFEFERPEKKSENN